MPKRKYYRTTYQGNPIKRVIFSILRFLKLFFLGIFILLLIIIVAGLSIFVYYAKDLPRPEKFTEKTFVQSTKIFDRTGKVLLYELYGEEKREIIPLSEVPDHLKNALIAVEDANFYSHQGLDFRAIVRSLLTDIKLLKPAFGASTISQQLIRSTFLTPEKTIKRKIREVILTIELERRYSKDQILEWYVNQIPFGPNLYGVESASKSFFGKQTKDLSLNESAVLAALVQAPSYLSPFGGNRDDLIVRKNRVLNRMVQENYITSEEAENNKKEEVKFSDGIQSIKAPHFVFYIQDYLFEKYGKDFLENEGFKVYTTLDWDLQQYAEKVVLEGTKKNKAYNAYNTALVAIDPKTGEILSMVGSADWFGKSYPDGCTSGKDCLFDPKVNVAAYNIGRQPGSAFKPIVYATAFQKGYNDKTIVIDEETNFGTFGGKPYIPQNYDMRFRGPVTLRQALSQSLNVPSVKVLAYLAGLNDSIEMAKKMGITTLTNPSSYYGLAIVLGGGEMKLVDLTSAYGVFATKGIRYPSTAILRIEDSNGNVIEEGKKSPKRVLEPESAELINDILSDNEARAGMFGRNSVMYFENYQVAVKTGTTGNYRDGWTIGYTPGIVVGVWTGNSNNAPMWGKPGAVVAGGMWRSVIEKYIITHQKEYFTKPEFIPSESTSPPLPTPVSP